MQKSENIQDQLLQACDEESGNEKIDNRNV